MLNGLVVFSLLYFPLSVATTSKPSLTLPAIITPGQIPKLPAECQLSSITCTQMGEVVPQWSHLYGKTISEVTPYVWRANFCTKMLSVKNSKANGTGNFRFLFEIKYVRKF